jgi:transposase
MQCAGGFFVTRAKTNMNARRIYSARVDRSTGIICDQTVLLNGFYSTHDYPENLRRVRFKDPESGKTLIFLTNNFMLPPLTIAALYKNRWQVELFFKWIKQHLRIKKFLGNSENAVKTQIWCAVSTYVLIAIVKKELQIDASLYTLLQILSVSVFEKNEISSAFKEGKLTTDSPDSANQLNLFDF